MTLFRHLLVALLLGLSAFAGAAAQLRRDIRLDGDSGRVLLFPRSQCATTRTLVYSLPVTIATQLIRVNDRHYQRGMTTPAIGHRHWWDAPLALSPAALLYGLKMGGARSENEWPRFMAIHATGGALVVTTRWMLKSFVNTTRPDWSSRASYPSGHTMLAFASAAMLEREYGHLTPAIPIGGYALATASAMTRVTSQRHWVSDVIQGFTLGTACANAGYAIADIVYKDRHRNHLSGPFVANPAKDRPSFVSVYSTARITTNALHYTALADGQPVSRSLSLKTGLSSGLEGACFLTPRWGVGGRAGISNYFPRFNGQPHSSSINMLDLQAGLYTAWPMGKRTLCGGAVLGGLHPSLSHGKLSQLGLDSHTQYSATLNLSLDYRLRRNMSMRFNCDYTRLQRHGGLDQLALGLATVYRLR